MATRSRRRSIAGWSHRQTLRHAGQVPPTQVGGVLCEPSRLDAGDGRWHRMRVRRARMACALRYPLAKGATQMSNESNKGEGMAQQVGGKIKQVVGKVIGNEQMETEGKAKEVEGKARVEAAKAAERTKGKVEEAVGTVKNRVGAVIDNEQMEAEGKVAELKGEARQKANE